MPRLFPAIQQNAQRSLHRHPLRRQDDTAAPRTGQ